MDCRPEPPCVVTDIPKRDIYDKNLQMGRVQEELKASEYDHEIPQTHSADQPTAPWRRETEQKQS